MPETSARLAHAAETRHVELFFRRHQAASDLLKLQVLPNVKEITESVGAYRALTEHVPWATPARADFTVVAVGDGCTPRTAALCAFWTAWSCVSLDPRLRAKRRWDAIKRLRLLRRRVEAEALHVDGDLAILAVHSHASTAETLRHVTCSGRRSLVALPCCVQDLPETEHIRYEDAGVWSPHRTIHVWPVI